MKKPLEDKKDIELLQSLLQKAVRRGNADIVRRVIQCLVRSGNLEWLRRRAAVLVFEECWTYGHEFNNESGEFELTEQFVHLARTIKNKNACGLGSLAYHSSLGAEMAIVSDSLENDLRVICAALGKPQPFWEWSNRRVENEKQKKLLQNAQRGFVEADLPWDRAFMLAATYLSFTANVPEKKFSNRVPGEFPFWIAIDRHTTLGVEKITEAANQINLEPELALWLTFYFEGAQCHEMVPSPWWEQERIWRLKSLGLKMEEGKLAFEKLKPILIELLREEAKKLSEIILNVET